MKYSTRHEYEVERKRSWHYVHVRIGADNGLLKSLSTFNLTADIRGIVEFAHRSGSSRHIQREQVLNDAGFSTFRYHYWLSPLPKKKIEILEVIGSTPA